MPTTTHTAPPDDLAHSIKGLLAAIEPHGPGTIVLVVHDGVEFYSRPVPHGAFSGRGVLACRYNRRATK